MPGFRAGDSRWWAAVVLATGSVADLFRSGAGRDPAPANGAAALVREIDGRYRIVAAEGNGLVTGQELSGAADATVRRARNTEKFVYTGVFVTPTGERRLGHALRADASPDSWIIYRETALRPPGHRRQLTSTQPFSEIETALYAGPTANPDQVVLATRALPIPGHTVDHVVEVGADRWLVVVAANRSLTGTLAGREPWLLLARGLIVTMLVSAPVEVLQRRRRYASALELGPSGGTRRAHRAAQPPADRRPARQERQLEAGVIPPSPEPADLE